VKTAVSIPDPTFTAAEGLAGRLGVSRSELYARALREFISAHQGEGITEALDHIYAQNESGIDPRLERLQAESLSREEW
jgi:metal-responsive CopG/Arc/MetJ family transcriptional regulator